MPSLYVLGTIVLDTAVRPVDSLPPWGSARNVDSISRHLGGNGAVAAYAAARSGASVLLAGAVGEDDAGELVLERLRFGGVDTSRVRVLGNAATASTVALIRPDGERLFLQDLGASALISSADVSFRDLGDSTHFHYGSIHSLAGAREGAGRTLARARRAGLRVSVDLDWDPRSEWLHTLGPLAPLIDLLFLNETEAQMLTGSAGRHAGRFLLAHGFREVVLKRGGTGCSYFSHQECFDEPAFSVSPVDATGAGDCFCGAFLAAELRGESTRGSARFANAAAALSTQSVGAADGAPDREKTLDLLANVASEARLA